MTQRKSEWTNLSESVWEYHIGQFDSPYRSTIKLIEFLDKYNLFDCAKNVLDVGCGCGGNINYMRKKYPAINFVGIDINTEFVEKGNLFFKNANVKNCSLMKYNLYKLDNSLKGKYDGIISFQTLSWLPEYGKPLRKLIKLDPKWIAISSLFYEGPVNCKIEIQYLNERISDTKCKKAHYNIYSLEEVKDFFKSHGYHHFKYIPFNIDIDLIKPKDNSMGTYTEKLEDGKRIQMSGPLLLPWYFIFATKH